MTALSAPRADALVAAGLRPAATGVAVLITVGAWLRPALTWTAPASSLTWWLTLLAGAAALIAVAAPKVPRTHVHAWMFAVLVLAYLSVAIDVALYHADAPDIAFLPIAIITTGILQLRRGWYTASLAVGWAICATALWIAPGIGISVVETWYVVCVVATGIATLALTSRRAAARNLLLGWDESAARAAKDPLTGLLNRRGLTEAVDSALPSSTSAPVAATVLFIDVNGLKKVNDTLGHDAGDAAITTVADALRTSVRGHDFICRWGGDEFVIVTVDPGVDAGEISARAGGHLAHSGVGITVGQADGRLTGPDSLHDLIGAADANMYDLREKLRGPGYRGRQ